MRMRFGFGLASILVATGACRSAPPEDRREAARALFEESRQKVENEDFRGAIRDLDEVVRLAPDIVEGYRWRAHCWVRLGDHDRALLDVGRGIALAPDLPWLHYARAVSLRETGRFRQAIESFTTAISLDPSNGKAFQHRGYSHAVLGEYERAVEDYTRALEVSPPDDPETVRIYALRADAYAALGRPLEAERDAWIYRSRSAPK